MTGIGRQLWRIRWEGEIYKVNINTTISLTATHNNEEDERTTKKKETKRITTTSRTCCGLVGRREGGNLRGQY